MIRRYAEVTRLLGFSYIRRRPLKAMLTVATLAAAVAVASSVPIEIHSYRSSFAGATRQLAEAAPLRVDSVSSHGGIDMATVERLRGLPEVDRAVPTVQAVTVLDHPGREELFVLALGVDCSIEAVVGPFGCTPNPRGVDPRTPPFISPIIAPAAREGATLFTDHNDVALQEAPELKALAGLNGGRVVVFPLAQAQYLFGRSETVDAVYLRPRPGTSLDELRSAAQDVIGNRARLSATSSPPPEAAQAMRALPPLALVALITAVIGGLMVFSLMRLAYEDRRRVYAIAWALGSRPKLILAATVTEAAVLGAVGGALGLGASVLVARPLVDSLSDLTQIFSGVTVTLRVGLSSVLIALGLGLVISIVAAMASSRWLARDFLPSLLPGRDSSDRQPIGAPTRALWRSLAVGGVGLLAAALGSSHGGIRVWQQPVGMVGLVLALLGLIGAAAVLVPTVLPLGSRRLLGRPGLLPLTVVDAARNSRKAIAIAITTASAVALAAVLGGAGSAVREGSTTFSKTFLGDRILVSRFEPRTPDLSGLVDARYAPDVVDRLRALPSVARLDEISFLYLRMDKPANTAVAADTGALPRYPVVEGTLPEQLAPGEAVIATGLARKRQLRVGSTLPVPTPAGTQRLRVVAVWQENSAVGDSMMVSSADFRRFWGEQAPIFLAVRPRPGVSLESLKQELTANLDDRAVVQTPADYAESVQAELNDILAPFWKMQQTLLIVVALATFVLLLLFGLQRVRQQAILQSIGMRPRQLVIMSCASAALVGTAGAVFGAFAGFGAAQAARWDGVFIVGTTPPFSGPGWSLALAVVAAAVTVVIGSIVPAVTTVRTDIVGRLRNE